ncbi:MAG: hypothetical protein IPJ61_19310 [Tessaracoccus sp.]|uniref:hypothetical protein n=1 Tax=Tessaracoccus sp. TaxID=1971211 RepID=UPI001EC3A5D5|nr:hypothetical protein [Tessaracoccus sp.]MBK7823137.1 hypothetical protein [Tessaracoccus sp.]
MAKQTEQLIDIDKIPDAPWHCAEWCGSLISVGGCDASDFGRDDVDRVVAFTRDGRGGRGRHRGGRQARGWPVRGVDDVAGRPGAGSAATRTVTADIYFAPTVEAALSTFGEVTREALRQMTQASPP